MAIEKSSMPTPPPVRKAPNSAPSKQSPAKVHQVDAEAHKKRVDGLNTIASTIQMGLLAARQTADAGALNRHAPAISESLVDYAESVGKAESLDRLSDISPIAGVVMATLPLLLQVAVNHNLFGLKAEGLATAGVVTPETLVSESNVYLMKIQQQAMQAEIEAQRDMQGSYNDLIEMQRMAAEAGAAAQEMSDMKAAANDSGD